LLLIILLAALIFVGNWLTHSIMNPTGKHGQVQDSACQSALLVCERVKEYFTFRDPVNESAESPAAFSFFKHIMTNASSCALESVGHICNKPGSDEEDAGTQLASPLSVHKASNCSAFFTWPIQLECWLGSWLAFWVLYFVGVGVILFDWLWCLIRSFFFGNIFLGAAMLVLIDRPSWTDRAVPARLFVGTFIFPLAFVGVVYFLRQSICQVIGSLVHVPVSLILNIVLWLANTLQFLLTSYIVWLLRFILEIAIPWVAGLLFLICFNPIQRAHKIYKLRQRAPDLHRPALFWAVVATQFCASSIEVFCCCHSVGLLVQSLSRAQGKPGRLIGQNGFAKWNRWCRSNCHPDDDQAFVAVARLMVVWPRDNVEPDMAVPRSLSFLLSLEKNWMGLRFCYTVAFVVEALLFMEGHDTLLWLTTLFTVVHVFCLHGLVKPWSNMTADLRFRSRQPATNAFQADVAERQEPFQFYLRLCRGCLMICFLPLVSFGTIDFTGVNFMALFGICWMYTTARKWGM
jgi:hypothetical protein